MTSESGGPAIKQGPAPKPDRDEVGEVAGNVREKGEARSPDERERGEASDAESCTAHDRAG